MTINKPLVSIITPTTASRSAYLERLFALIRLQDYPNIEHVIEYGDGTTGAKRNVCCERARGSIIVTMDDDDSYAPDWISKSVNALLSSRADIVGLSSALFQYGQELWRYDYPTHENIHGATMCYKREYWEQHKFANIQVGEDTTFTKGAKLFSHGYIEGFTATIHDSNTSPKNLSGDRWVQIKRGYRNIPTTQLKTRCD